MPDEIDRLRADLKGMAEYALKLDASNDDYQAEIEALRKELDKANAIIHGMQDGALVRDQMGVIERAEADCKALREALEGMIAVAEGRFDGNPHADIDALAIARAALNSPQDQLAQGAAADETPVPPASKSPASDQP